MAAPASKSPGSPRKVAVLGTGKVGRLVVHLLAGCGDYAVTAVDADPAGAQAAAEGRSAVTPVTCDLSDTSALAELLPGHDYVVSCAPFHLTAAVAQAAKDAGCHYIDPTEDVATTNLVKGLAKGAGQAFIPQCGLAPGFISIVAHHIASGFDSLESVKMRVGALPVYPHNWLKYNLTWSTDGLINEYCEPCDAVVDGKLVKVPPLADVERLNVDGLEYEAFNTSGGLGTLAETLAGKVRSLNYKSIRYPGHRDSIHLLLEELGFKDDRATLKAVMERSLPHTYQDVVLIFVTVTGSKGKRFAQKSYVKKIYADESGDEPWGAIQLTTAAGLCGVLDLHATGVLPASGFVRQEDIPFDAFIANRFGRAYA